MLNIYSIKASNKVINPYLVSNLSLSVMWGCLLNRANAT